MSLKTFLICRGTRKSDKKRDAGLTSPTDVLRVDNLSYGPDKMNVLDVYRPKNVTGKLPVIVSVHGGAWIYGDKELYQYYCMSLAQRGFAVVNFSYRLAPKHKFPAHLEDTTKVFHWVLKNAKTFELDTENIFAVGDSAGAHILSLFCIMCTNPSYAANYSFNPPENFCPKAVALNCGVYNLSTERAGVLLQIKKDILPRKGIEEELYSVSPIHFIDKNFPPCYIMTANEDFLRDQTEELEKKLKELAIPYTYTLYGDDSNPLQHVFHLDMRNQTGTLCNDTQCNYFKTFL